MMSMNISSIKRSLNDSIFISIPLNRVLPALSHADMSQPRASARHQLGKFIY